MILDFGLWESDLSAQDEGSSRSKLSLIVDDAGLFFGLIIVGKENVGGGDLLPVQQS